MAAVVKLLSIFKNYIAGRAHNSKYDSSFYTICYLHDNSVHFVMRYFESIMPKLYGAMANEMITYYLM
jgi:hypothetical protein